MAAFHKRRTWVQAELARAVELTPEALRRVLADLLESGAMRLESEKSPPHVYWRAPRTWYPGGILFEAQHVPELLRQLSRLPRGKARDRMLDIVDEQLPGRGKLKTRAPLVSRAISEQEEQYLPTVEDAAARKVPLHMKYLSASRGGKVRERRVSVMQIDPGPPARFIAMCHENRDLRWFRVEGIMRARADDTEAFRGCSDDEVAAFRDSSIDGYRGPGPVVPCSFFVREPESSWVTNSLLDGMRAESLTGGIRVTANTSAVVRLARFVVSLGDAATPETPDLAEAVIELARGALDQARAAVSETENAPASGQVASSTARAHSDV
jgi:hypothetical protein